MLSLPSGIGLPLRQPSILALVSSSFSFIIACHSLSDSVVSHQAHGHPSLSSFSMVAIWGSQKVLFMFKLGVFTDLPTYVLVYWAKEHFEDFHIPNLQWHLILLGENTAIQNISTARVSPYTHYRSHPWSFRLSIL